jgi:type II secretory pathway predicted ATPase ExeA
VYTKIRNKEGESVCQVVGSGQALTKKKQQNSQPEGEKEIIGSISSEMGSQKTSMEQLAKYLHSVKKVKIATSLQKKRQG